MTAEEREQISVDQERTDRITLWQSLVARGAVRTVAASAVTKELLGSGGRLFVGQRATWRDKARLAVLPGAPEGVTVAIFRGGDDDDAAHGPAMRCSYPSTGRPGADAGDVLATKRAFELGLPIFVITTERGTTNRRNIRLGWIAGADDATETFDVRFDNGDGAPGAWVDDAARMQFAAIRRFGRACAVCGTADAARLHVVTLDTPIALGDERLEQLVLCTFHQRMLQQGTFTIDPETAVVSSRNGWTLQNMSITRSDLSHLLTTAG